MSDPKTSNYSAADENTPLLTVSEASPTVQPNEELPNGVANGHANGVGREIRNLILNANGKPLDPHAESPTLSEDDTPLPKSQIFLLCYASLIEPVAYFAIFPFINQMIKDTGDIDEENVGFWSGTIESLFSLVQMLLMIIYGRIADRLGRKPVLVFSLVGISVATALFGFSKTVWQMIAFRCFAGVFAGSAVTVRAMITENCTAKTQARAFSFYAFTRNLGIFLGPLIGGGLADPAGQYGSVFANNQFFLDYPYALPTIVTGALSASATALIALFAKETLNCKIEGAAGKEAPMSIWEIIRSDGVGMVLYLYAHTMLLGLAFTAVVPVFFFTQPKLGGFGFSPGLISIFLAVAGGCQALWILLAFPPLQHRYSTGAVLRVCAIIWPFMFALFPIGNEFLRHDLNPGMWVVAAINAVVGSGVSMAFTCVQLCLNDIAPSASTLGTLNALALTINSGVRAVSPALFSAIFATGVRLGWIDGHLVWIVLILIASGLSVTAQWLPRKAEGRIKKDGDPA